VLAVAKTFGVSFLGFLASRLPLRLLPFDILYCSKELILRPWHSLASRYGESRSGESRSGESRSGESRSGNIAAKSIAPDVRQNTIKNCEQQKGLLARGLIRN
jgi:hypothetical protein